MCAMSASARCLYVTGEESLQQVALRARRLGLREDHLQLMTETCVERIMETADRYQPEVMVLDSVQTMYSEALTSAPGSVSQVRDSAAMLVRLAKQRGTSVFIVGHVTKDGSLAGPRVLEHMVDAVLYFEGESDGRYRMIRAYKNRFGTVNELGVFAMTEQGLKPVSNPSAIFLSRPATPAPGSLVAVIREGSRPLLIEVQTLMDEGAGGNPRRVAVGLDSNRLAMLLAVLSRHGGLPIHGMDVFVNIVGGIKVMETATDLAVCLSLVSALRKQALPRDLLVFGEVGLAGEIRPVPNGQERLKEAAKQGFGHALVPEKNQPRQAIPGLRVWPCERLDQALSLVGEIAEASSPAPA
jgi:DNA repair protein RadA/Sms